MTATMTEIETSAHLTEGYPEEIRTREAIENLNSILKNQVRASQPGPVAYATRSRPGSTHGDAPWAGRRGAGRGLRGLPRPPFWR